MSRHLAQRFLESASNDLYAELLVSRELELVQRWFSLFLARSEVAPPLPW